MIRIRLAEEDRQRYQLDEWIEYEQTSPRLSEMRRVKAEVGMTWAQMDESLNADDLDERIAARAVLVWLAVNRHHTVSWDDFELKPLDAQIEDVPDPNRSAPTGASKTSTGTSPRSRRSTASARGRSTS